MFNIDRRPSFQSFLHQPQVIKFWPQGLGYPSVPVTFTIESLLDDDVTFTNTLPDKLKKQIGRESTSLAVRYLGILSRHVDHPDLLKGIVETTAAGRELSQAKRIKKFITGKLGVYDSELAQDLLEELVLFDRAGQEEERKMSEKAGVELRVNPDQLDYEALGKKARKLIDETREAIDVAFEEEYGFPACGTGEGLSEDLQHLRNKHLEKREMRRRSLSQRSGRDVGDEEEELQRIEDEELERIEQESEDDGYGPEYYAEVERLRQESPGHEPQYYSGIVHRNGLPSDGRRPVESMEEDIEDEEVEDGDEEMEEEEEEEVFTSLLNSGDSYPKRAPLQKTSFGTILKIGSGSTRRDSAASPKLSNPFSTQGSPTKNRKKVNFSPTKSSPVGSRKSWGSSREVGAGVGKKVKGDEGLRRSARRKSK